MYHTHALMHICTFAHGVCPPWVNDYSIPGFLFIRMPLQNMDNHLDVLKSHCHCWTQSSEISVVINTLFL